MLILLDGSKGAGKTSVSKIIMDNRPGLVYSGLDSERRSLPNQAKSRRELNQDAFTAMIEKAQKSLEAGKDVIIDCGLTSERIAIFEDLAKNTNSKLYKFFLKASYDTLLERVRLRDKASNRATDENRFDEVYK